MTAATQAGELIFWEWVRILRRAELGFGTGKKRIGSNIVQHVAMMACTYGNPDGSRIRPGLNRLARVCRLDPETVRRCLTRLRELGLFRRVFEGSKAGRAGGKSDEYQLDIPEDLAERVAMLDPDEHELIVPEGVEPPPVRTPRTKRAATSEDGSPGAAPADEPVDNPPQESPVAPNAAPPGEEHPVLPPETPGAAPGNTRCSTVPPTHAPTNHLPAHNFPPYGAEVEGVPGQRREPSAEIDPPPKILTLSTLRALDPAEAYAAAAAELSRLPEFGQPWIAAARRELGEHTPRSQLVVRAHALYAERRAS
ncbi:hypothetical protein [Nonomuraea sediminis]|uniref:hypothetical protein n=1 Tax=Nonomuraea sediminis TaxID=2835864 RepID=UPI001BDBD1B1|nr:hypothetical protein [Nonomuraea sediminis]